MRPRFPSLIGYSSWLSTYLLFGFLLGFSSISVAQSSKEKEAVTHDHGKEISFCGTYGGLKPNPLEGENLYHDRFGNVLTERDLMASGKGESLAKMQTGYFGLQFVGELPPDEVLEEIERVLLDLSGMIAQRDLVTQDCEPAPVNIQFAYHDLYDDEWPFWQNLQIDPTTLPSPGSGVLGIGSPFYQFDNISNCKNVGVDLPYRAINGGGSGSTSAVGRVIINSNLQDVSPTATYYTGQDPTGISSGQVDLYSVFLHEMLHVLGIASLLDSSADIFSRYDQEIEFVEDNGDSEPALVATTDRFYCYEVIPAVASSATNQCGNGQPALAINGTNELAVQGQTGAENLDNLLSHFANVCGDEVDYVMTTSLVVGETNRQISDEELQLFCDLGYSVPAIECDGCYLSGKTAQYDFENPCTDLPIICEGETVTLDLAQYLNIETNAELAYGTPFPRYPTQWDGINVTLDSAAGTITLEVIDAITTYPSFFIPYQTCEGDRTGVLQLLVFVRENCTDCTPNTEIDCENISCYTDFEDNVATRDNAVFRFAGNPRALGRTGSSSVDIIRHVNSDNSYLGTSGSPFNREVVILPLLETIDPGCRFTVEFLAATRSGASTSLHLWGSNQPICSLNNSSEGMPFNCDYGGTSCDDGTLFNPVCLQEFTGLPNDGPVDQDNPPAFGSLSFSSGTYSGEPLNYLYLVADGDFVYLDNFVVTKECSPQLSSTDTGPAEVCRGESFTVAFEFCLTSPEPVTDVSLSTQTTEGLTYELLGPNNFSLAEGQCVTVSYAVSTNASTPLGLAAVVPNAQSTGACGLVGGFITEFSFAVTECQAPCLPLDADEVGDEACNVSISALTGTGCGDVFWPPNALENRSIYIAEELVIDQDYQFIDCEIIMGPNARILVKSGRHLQIRGSDGSELSRVHGCDTLWESIIVQSKAKLTADNTQIEDAYTAIIPESGGAVALSRSRLLDNFVTLYFDNPGELGANLASCHSNVFEQLAPLLPFTGVPLAALPPIGERAYCALFSDGNGLDTPIRVGIVPGGPQPTEPSPNIFRNLANGIVSHATVLEIKQSRFLNIQADSPWGSYATAGYGIHNVAQGRNFVQTGLSGPTNLTSFDSCLVGIHVQYGPVSISNNRFERTGTGVSIRNIFQQTDIFSNHYFGGANAVAGIRVVDDSGHRGSLAIHHNRITGADYGAISVAITGGYQQEALPGRIEGNQIRVLSSGRGISGKNLRDYQIDANYLKLVDAGPFVLSGISLAGGKNITVELNEIIGQGRGDGIVLSDSPGTNLAVKCNTFTSLYRGVSIRGNWSSTNFRTNRFSGTFFDGFSYGSQVTSMTPQLYTGTNWGLATFGGSALAHYLPAGLPDFYSILAAQRWRAGQGQPVPSVSVLNYGISGVDAFYQESSFTPAPQLCDTAETPDSIKVADTRSTDVPQSVAAAPNPTMGEVSITYPPTAGEPLQIVLFSSKGIELQQFSLAPKEQTGRFRLNLEKHAAGVYIVAINNGQSVETLRVVKQ